MYTAEELRFKTGQGNWKDCVFDVDVLLREAERWKNQLAGLKKGWLCWNVDDDWCLVQQRLVEQVGWIPIVGFDPRKGPPRRLSRNAVLVDFNASLQLPAMYPHFPLEFAFAYIDRVAFWHSDLLIRLDRMRQIAEIFDGLPDGSMAAIPERRLRHLLQPKQHRFWELVGCTTRGASRSQFENGCGWWMLYWSHPNQKQPDAPRFKGANWDHGAGIMEWHRHHGGQVREIPLDWVEEGHFSQINNANYKRVSPKHYMRDMSAELSLNYGLVDAARKMGLESLLHA